jgi:hypothetical protein
MAKKKQQIWMDQRMFEELVVAIHSGEEDGLDEYHINFKTNKDGRVIGAEIIGEVMQQYAERVGEYE